MILIRGEFNKAASYICKWGVGMSLYIAVLREIFPASVFPQESRFGVLGAGMAVGLGIGAPIWFALRGRMRKNGPGPAG